MPVGRRKKPTFVELVDAMLKLVRTDTERWLLKGSVGSYDDAEACLSQLIARTSDPVVRMLAEMALRVR